MSTVFVAGVLLVAPVLAMVAPLAVGGVIGCAECVLDRLGAIAMAPAVLHHRHRGLPAH